MKALHLMPLVLFFALAHVGCHSDVVGASCEADADCDDGDRCNGEEACSEGFCVVGAAPVDCEEEEEEEEACPEGQVDVGADCEPIVCEDDSDCSGGDTCSGEERCDRERNRCVRGAPFDCGSGGSCELDGGGAPICICDETSVWSEGRCEPRCPVPQAPVLDVIADDEALVFAYDGEGAVETSVRPEAQRDDAPFVVGSQVSLAGMEGRVQVLARGVESPCGSEGVFEAIYDVQATYPPPVGEVGTTAISEDDPSIVAWATGHAALTFGEGVDAAVQVAAHGYGPPDEQVLSLGHGGSVVLTFDEPLFDGPGPDFVVFENAFNDTFLELAFVEVSSDGERFVRFDSAWRGPGPVPAFGPTDTRVVGGLAGKYRAGWGTPFDLRSLANREEVRDGTLDLQRITHVRIVDVFGDGSTLDSFGRPIYAPYPATQTAGFDLDAVGAIHVRP